MADRPILFSAPMIRALLAGTKTQTRRILKPQPNMLNGGKPMNDGRGSYSVEGGWKRYPISKGDRIWVRETLACSYGWGLFYDAHGGIGPSEEHFLKDERANAIVERYARDEETIWNVPSIFMPRWASRLTLTVTNVRIERLNAINREDAIAEGLVKVAHAPPMAVELGCDWGFEGDDRYGSPISAYAALWDHINGAGAWEANPWVVAYTFTVHHGNIDQIAQVAA